VFDEGGLKIFKGEMCRFLFMNPEGLTMQKFLALVLYSRINTIFIMHNLIPLAS